MTRLLLGVKLFLEIEQVLPVISRHRRRRAKYHEDRAHNWRDDRPLVAQHLVLPLGLRNGGVFRLSAKARMLGGARHLSCPNSVPPRQTSPSSTGSSTFLACAPSA